MGWAFERAMVRIRVTCDSPNPDEPGGVCGYTDDDCATDEATAMDNMRLYGWTIVGNSARCSECTRAGRPFGKPEASDE